MKQSRIRDIENRLVVAKVEGGERVLDWDQQIQTGIYRMDKEQAPTVAQGTIFSVQ